MTVVNYRNQVFKSREPFWSKENKRFELKLSHRCEEPSIKNFILENKEGEIVMILGKIDETSYTLEIFKELSVIECFAICLSSVVKKLIC